MHKAVMLAAAGICSVMIAGCANSMNPASNSSGQKAAPGGTTAMTVSVRTASGIGKVLVDNKGRTLYLDDQEKSGKILCAKADCTAIWAPLTMRGGDAPTGPSSVNAKLGTLKRPDGTTQVTLNGAPLYTFADDHVPGDVKGDGQKDQFDGTSFSWHAATPNGPAADQSGSSNGGGYGGY